MDANAQMNKAQRVAAIMGVQASPRDFVPELAVMDPIAFPFTIAAGALTATTFTDLTQAELVPYGVDSTGVLKSAGSAKNFVGWIWGAAVVLGPASSSDADIISRAFQLVVVAGGQTRAVPFAEALRYNPGRMLTTNATDAATGCPSAPGKPQYVFPGSPVTWTANKSNDKVGIYVAGTGTVAAEVKGQLMIWPAMAPGDGEDVKQGSAPGVPCGEPRTVRDFAAVMAYLANIARIRAGGGLLTR